MVHNLKPHSRDQSPTLGNLNILKRGKGTKPRALRIIPSPKIGLLKNGLAMQPHQMGLQPYEWRCSPNKWRCSPISKSESPSLSPE